MKRKRIAYVWKNFGIDYVSWARRPGLDTSNRVRVPGSIKLAWPQRPALDTASNPVRLLGDPDPDWGNCWPFRSSIIGGADEAVGSIIGRSATLVSPSGRYKARMQRDCNFVLYDTYRDTNKVVWASDTFGKGTECSLILQIDANLVLLDAKGTILFVSGAFCDSCALTAALSVTDGGYIVIWETDYQTELWRKP
ncbi:hypothetical protein SELMODRAFT_420673 [Selaginella moellendorffii]|uniref:Bulb-type lectin domain-containing protein n=1 Tax=Selaginella moellendorffii TaxID=88036 RepID=D8SCR5_SELML|nr:hypothetical protein SELMODRAFT_420673 [Selaginella moellendorffii]